MKWQPYSVELPDIVWKVLFALAQETMMRWQEQESEARQKYWSEVRRNFFGSQSIEHLIEYAGEAGLGVETEDKKARAIFQRMPPGSLIGDVSLATPAFKVLTREQVLNEKTYMVVGTLLIPLDSPKWAYCIPMSSPLLKTRVFKLTSKGIK